MNTTSTNPKSNPPQNILSRLQDYMFTENLINQTLENRLIQTEIPIKNNKNMYSKQSPNKEINSMFVPKQKDSLFWCFYIIMNGQYKYDMLEHINVVIEKKLKIEYIEKIRKEKQIVKKYKFATLTHLETVLANEDKIDLSTFLTMCVIEGINILYICKKTYFELLMNDDKIHIIHRLDNYSKYGYEGLEKSKIELYRSTLFKVDSVEKPIKSISSYKVSELVEFCTKLGIEICVKDTTKNKSKKDLYESLIQYF
jgi:hypothetical protein